MHAHDKQEFLRLLQVLQADRAAGIGMDGEVFEASLQVFPQAAVEAVICRRVDDGTARGRIDVLLTQRPADDRWFPSRFHVPGSFNRAREKTKETIDRILRRELGGTARLLSVQFVTATNNWDEPRGHTWSIVLCCEVEGDPAHGQWFGADHLPDNLVDTHRDIIPAALQPFRCNPYPFRARWPELLGPKPA